MAASGVVATPDAVAVPIILRLPFALRFLSGLCGISCPPRFLTYPSCLDKPPRDKPKRPVLPPFGVRVFALAGRVGNNARPPLLKSFPGLADRAGRSRQATSRELSNVGWRRGEGGR